MSNFTHTTISCFLFLHISLNWRYFARWNLLSVMENLPPFWNITLSLIFLLFSFFSLHHQRSLWFHADRHFFYIYFYLSILTSIYCYPYWSSTLLRPNGFPLRQWLQQFPRPSSLCITLHSRFKWEVWPQDHPHVPAKCGWYCWLSSKNCEEYKEPADPCPFWLLLDWQTLHLFSRPQTFYSF